MRKTRTRKQEEKEETGRNAGQARKLRTMGQGRRRRGGEGLASEEMERGRWGEEGRGGQRG